MGDIYGMAAAHGMDVVGGGSQTVSIGGYMTGGGHSALSSTYGMAADQVLEVEIVTASGEIVKANECQNSDLFWAVRGVRVHLGCRCTDEELTLPRAAGRPSAFLHRSRPPCTPKSQPHSTKSSSRLRPPTSIGGTPWCTSLANSLDCPTTE